MYRLFIIMSICWLFTGCQTIEQSSPEDQRLHYKSNGFKAAIEKADQFYRPLSSHELQRKWMANSSQSDLKFPAPRHSRAVDMKTFWYGMATSFADMNGDGIDDIVTTGVPGALDQPKYRPDGKCGMDTSKSTDWNVDRPGCIVSALRNSPKIAYGKPGGGYEVSSNKMFIHPEPKNGKHPGLIYPGDINLVDFNGDNIPDIFVRETGIGWKGDYSGLYLSNADGTWAYSTFSNVKGVQRDFAHAGTVGDIDGDGDIDIITAKSGSGMACWFNDGRGNFKYKSKCYGGSIGYATALGDVDGDGDLDAYWGSNSYSGETGVSQWGGFHVLENNGRGQFTKRVSLPQQACWVTNPHTDVADVDGDGDMDFVAIFVGETYAFTAIQIIENLGNWKFKQTVVPVFTWDSFDPASRKHYQIKYRFGDGKSDKCGMFYRDGDKWKKQIYEGHPLTNYPEDLRFVDADGDGDKDILMGMPMAMDGWTPNNVIKGLNGGYLANMGGGKWVHRTRRGPIKEVRY